MRPRSLRELLDGQLARQLAGRTPGILARGSDGALERRFGAPLVERLSFTAMARSYDRQVAPEFTGAIVYELTRPATGAAASCWTIVVSDGRAAARAGEPDDGVAAVSVRLPVADFLRIAAGRIDPAEPLLSGRAQISGDLALASRLPEMFGARRPR